VLGGDNFVGLLASDPVQWDRTEFVAREIIGRDIIARDILMKRIILAILLVSSPAWAQTKLAPKSATARVDNCAPIGRTADGQLVYSMKCENLPVPAASPPPQAEATPAPPPQPEVRRSGIFGLSFEVKRPDE
jgi:hypothetical protein